MRRRLLRIVCVALNFLRANFVPIPLPLLQRPPTRAQLNLIDHVGRHLKAFGAAVGECNLPDAGRRNPQLVARLCELVDSIATAILPGTLYVPVDNTVQPALEPYRSLEVSRLKISGHGGFDPVPFLGDALYMAKVEPNSLLHGAPVPEHACPILPQLVARKRL